VQQENVVDSEEVSETEAVEEAETEAVEVVEEEVVVKKKKNGFQ
jgi:hypothetical protein